jgi:hypothetical protein
MCDGKIVWGIVRKGNPNPFPVCNAHTGQVMEAVYRLDGPEFAFMFVGDHEIPAGTKCIGANVGKSISLRAEASFSVLPPTSFEGKPAAGVSHSAEVIG